MFGYKGSEDGLKEALGMMIVLFLIVGSVGFYKSGIVGDFVGDIKSSPAPAINLSASFAKWKEINSNQCGYNEKC